MPAPSDPTHTVEVTCPGCFHPQQWDASAACPICHHRANAGRSAALLPVGTQLKGYVIGEKLGQGGFGITYRGFDLTLKMKVAIKEYYPSEFVGRSTNRKAVVLNGQDHEDLFQYGLKTFLKEAQTIAQLRHPHLVRVFNYFELNETAYLVMDYLEGEDLSKRLKPPKGQRGTPMPWPRAVKLLLPVLEGLYRVHQAGFMHRDLKPGNLYLTKDDELIVLDFGSARQVTSNHTRSLLIFSEGYAPYEQYLQGHLNRQGPWTDVYAIAATLYFMLTGCRLPSAMDRKQAELLQQPDPLKPARHFVPELPAALDAVLMRALVVEPELRLPTVVDLKQQLERVLVQAEPIALPPKSKKAAPEPLKVSPPTPKPVAPKPAPNPDVAPPQPKKVASELRKKVLPLKGASKPPETPFKHKKTSELLAMQWVTAMVTVVAIGLMALAGGWQLWKKLQTSRDSPHVTVATPAPVTRPNPTTPLVASAPVALPLKQRFTDNGDGTVTDNQSSLVWLKDVNCFGVNKWSKAMNLAKRLKNGQCGLHDGSVAMQWRLPSKEEWNTLIDKSARNPALPVGYPFIGVWSSGYYWSSTSDAADTSDAWLANLYNGSVILYGKTSYDGYVWPVRDGR